MVGVPEWPCWHEEWRIRSKKVVLVWMSNMYLLWKSCFFVCAFKYISNPECTTITAIRATLLRERETHTILKQIRHHLKVRISLSERKGHSRLGTLKASVYCTHRGFHGNSHSRQPPSGCLGLIDFDICGSLRTKHDMVHRMELCIQPFTYHCCYRCRC